MNPKAIGENIRRLRKEQLFLTQEEFADQTGIDVRTIQRAENGEPVSLQTLKDIANPLGTTPDKLAQAQPVLLKPGGVCWWPAGQRSPITSIREGCRELDAIRGKAGSDWYSVHNEHVHACPTCRGNKERLYIDWRGFDDSKEIILEWVVDSNLIDLKRALDYEESLSLEGVLSEEGILAINARFREAERQWASANGEEAAIWEALDRDLIDILERTECQKQRAP